MPFCKVLISHHLMQYTILYDSYPTPLYSIWLAIRSFFHTTLSRIACYAILFPHHLIPYAMLYDPYSAPPYSICHVLGSLFQTTSFHMICYMILIPHRLIPYAIIYDSCSPPPPQHWFYCVYEPFPPDVLAFFFYLCQWPEHLLWTDTKYSFVSSSLSCDSEGNPCFTLHHILLSQVQNFDRS